MALWRVTVPITLPTGEGALFTWHAEGAITDAAALTAADGWLTGLGAIATFKGVFPSAMTWGPVTLSTLSTTDDHVITTRFGSGTFAGTGGATSCPPQVAMCVTLRTALAGRSFRGRCYLPPPITARLTSNGRLLSTTATDLIVALANAWIAVGVAGMALVVRSFAHHTSTNVTQIEIGDVMDTQRSRRSALTEVRQSHAL